MLGASGITNSRQTAGISLNHKRGALALYGGYTLAGCQTRVPDEAQIDYLAGPNADATAIHLLTSATPPASSCTTPRPASTGSWGPAPALTCTRVACAPTAPVPLMRPRGGCTSRRGLIRH